MNKAQKIFFYKDNRISSWGNETKEYEDELLFIGEKWYDVIDQVGTIIYVEAENGERIGIDMKENPHLFCIKSY